MKIGPSVPSTPQSSETFQRIVRLVDEAYDLVMQTRLDQQNDVADALVRAHEAAEDALTAVAKAEGIDLSDI